MTGLTVTKVQEGSWPTLVRVQREPSVYHARLVPDPTQGSGFRAVATGEDRSYVRDLVAARMGGDSEARERLERHGRQAAEARERRSLDLAPDAEYEPAPEARAATSSYADPPLWINEYFATAPRPGRVLAALSPQFALPEGVATVNLPRLTTGTLTGQQAPGGTVPSRDLTDAAVTSAVSAIAGRADVPLQLLEQSPSGAHLDWVVFTDLEADYNLQLETALLAGTGAGTQLLGLLNNLANPYTNNPNVAYADATPTATEMVPFLGQVMAAVGRNRRLPPTRWMLPSPRVAWIASSEDQQNRPLALANSDGAGHFDLLTVPVSVNDAIQPVYGAGGNEERIIACRPEDWLVLETERSTDAMEDVLSGSLMVRLVLRRSVAALCRYPSGHAVLSGVGLIPVSGY